MALGPFFFTSYARLDNNKHTKLGEALDELRERVRGKLGATRADEVGFFDLEDIQTGQRWIERLGGVVARCRVFVCFCSRTYFNREVCGKEFEVFRKRLAVPAPGARYVFPVIWDKCVLPAALGAYHADNAGFPREYFDDGLCALRRLRREAEYETTIEALATAIAAAANDPPLPPGVPVVDFDGVPSAFDNPAAESVRIGLFGDQGLFWQSEIGRTARSLAEEAAASERVGWRQFEVRDDVALRIAELGASGDPLILIAPSNAGAAWANRLNAVDVALARDTTTPCAVLVEYVAQPPIGTTTGQAAIEEAIRSAVPLSFEGSTRHEAFESGSATSLLQKLRSVISKLRIDLNHRRDAARVSDPVLEASARAAGVPIASHPVVDGPKATS
jgi:TIR domain-containing protein